jgi:hypothetical protein
MRRNSAQSTPQKPAKGSGYRRTNSLQPEATGHLMSAVELRVCVDDARLDPGLAHAQEQTAYDQTCIILDESSAEGDDSKPKCDDA